MNLSPGAPLPEFVVESVPVEAMKTMALLLRDPNPIHWDVDAVRKLGMGDRVINQGPTNMAYVINMLIAWAGDPGRVRSLNVRFRDNVRAGDRVTAGGTITEVREREGERVAVCDVWLDVADGTRALSGTAVVAV